MEILKQESSDSLTNTSNFAQRLTYNPFREQVIEEVAQHIEKMTGFGNDTISSFAIYIRSLK